MKRLLWVHGHTQKFCRRRSREKTSACDTHAHVSAILPLGRDKSRKSSRLHPFTQRSRSTSPWSSIENMDPANALMDILIGIPILLLRILAKLTPYARKAFKVSPKPARKPNWLQISFGLYFKTF